jgi:hypothetical protein
VPLEVVSDPPVPALLDASLVAEAVVVVAVVAVVVADAPPALTLLEAPPALVVGSLPPLPVLVVPPPAPPSRGSRLSHPKEQPKTLAPSAPPTRSD